MDDGKFLEGVSGKPDPQLARGFQSAAGKAQSMAESLRKANPKNPDALFSLALVYGMMGNYKAIIEHKHLEGLRLTERAEKIAVELLAIQPGAKDAYLPIGASNYIVGSLSSPKRFFLWFGGITGDRQAGMKQLQQAADGGHYLRPYAKILLALASLREKQPEPARVLLEELRAEFPANPLFAKELALLKQRGATASTE
ncbi:MAG: hypothetical protein HY046_11800 [Acidobacteria bacterium]|nr:hypothetical protein [Acidobacteriota bacterium]